MSEIRADIVWEHMSWESNFFGFPVACMQPNEDLLSMEMALKQLKQSGYRLVYTFCDPLSKMHSFWINRGALLASTRQKWLLELKSDQYLPEPEVELCNAEFPFEELKLLAIQSGMYSRYRRDLNFPLGAFESMYLEWIRKSVSGEMADFVWFIRDQGMIAGMLTTKVQANEASIGLFAVLNIFRRKGIGTKLLNHACYHLKKKGISTYSVITQAENREACRFYKQYGFEDVSFQHALHLWL